MEQQAKYAGWFAVGAGLGAALALLFAPSSGEQTRKRLKDKVSRTKQQISESVEDITDELEEAREVPQNRLSNSKVLEEGLNTLVKYNKEQ
jgi:gas vesicle protein